MIFDLHLIKFCSFFWFGICRRRDHSRALRWWMWQWQKHCDHAVAAFDFSSLHISRNIFRDLDEYLWQLTRVNICKKKMHTHTHHNWVVIQATLLRDELRVAVHILGESNFLPSFCNTTAWKHLVSFGCHICSIAEEYFERSSQALFFTIGYFNRTKWWNIVTHTEETASSQGCWQRERD